MSEKESASLSKENAQIAESGNPCGQDTNPPGQPAEETDATCVYRRTPPGEHDEHDETYPTAPYHTGHTQPTSNPVDIHSPRQSDPQRWSGHRYTFGSPSEYLRSVSSGSSFLELNLSGRLSSSLNSKCKYLRNDFYKYFFLK